MSVAHVVTEILNGFMFVLVFLKGRKEREREEHDSALLTPRSPTPHRPDALKLQGAENKVESTPTIAEESK